MTVHLQSLIMEQEILRVIASCLGLDHQSRLCRRDIKLLQTDRRWFLQRWCMELEIYKNSSSWWNYHQPFSSSAFHSPWQGMRKLSPQYHQLLTPKQQGGSCCERQVRRLITSVKSMSLLYDQWPLFPLFPLPLLKTSWKSLSILMFSIWMFLQVIRSKWTS